MGYQDAVFLPTQARSTPHFLKIVVEEKAVAPPHVLNLWLGVSKGMLPVKYISSNKASFV